MQCRSSLPDVDVPYDLYSSTPPQVVCFTPGPACIEQNTAAVIDWRRKNTEAILSSFGFYHENTV